MRNRGKLPFLWQFAFFVVSSRVEAGVFFSRFGKSQTVSGGAKGVLHDTERTVLMRGICKTLSKVRVEAFRKFTFAEIRDPQTQ